MEVLAEVFVRYWEEVIVAVLLTVTLPFIRKYVRRQRAKMLNIFKEKERLQEALRKAEELADSERKAREELERKLEAETEERKKAQSDAENLRTELEQERKVREELERKCQAEIDEKQKAQSEAEEKRKTSQVDWNALLSELGKILPPRPHEDRVYIPQNRILWIDEHIELTNLTKLTERLLRVVDLYVFSLKYDKENASKVANAERMAVLTYLAVYIAKCKCDGKSELDIINDSGVKEVLDRVCATKKDLELFLTDKATTQNMMQFIGEASSHVEKEFKI